MSDAGLWVTGRFEERNRRLVGLADLEVAPILGPAGRTLMEARRADAESLAMAGPRAYVGIEGANEVRVFPFARDGVNSRGEKRPLPAAVARLPRNRGLEAIGVVPAGAPLAGTLVAVGEGSNGDDGPSKGFLIGGPTPGGFEVRRFDGFDITDLAFLPGGDMVLLERRASFVQGIAMRLRRIAARDIGRGAMLDGQVLMEAGTDCQIDNMEALAVSTDAAGETILTVMSDDNYSFLERNLVLRFALVGPGS